MALVTESRLKLLRMRDADMMMPSCLQRDAHLLVAAMDLQAYQGQDEDERG